jgi:hypothetical protein
MRADGYFGVRRTKDLRLNIDHSLQPVGTMRDLRRDGKRMLSACELVSPQPNYCRQT